MPGSPSTPAPQPSWSVTSLLPQSLRPLLSPALQTQIMTVLQEKKVLPPQVSTSLQTYHGQPLNQALTVVGHSSYSPFPWWPFLTLGRDRFALHLVSTCLVAPRNWFGFCSSQRTALWSLVSSEGSSSDYIQQTGPAKMLAYTATGMAALLLRQVAHHN